MYPPYDGRSLTRNGQRQADGGDRRDDKSDDSTKSDKPAMSARTRAAGTLRATAQPGV